MNFGHVAMFVKPGTQNRFGNSNFHQDVTHKQTFGYKKNSDASTICDYCNLASHTRDVCFCLHGYPSWHRLFGNPKPKPRGTIRANNVHQSTSLAQAPTPVISAHKHQALLLHHLTVLECLRLSILNSFRRYRSLCNLLVTLQQIGGLLIALSIQCTLQVSFSTLLAMCILLINTLKINGSLIQVPLITLHPILTY